MSTTPLMFNIPVLPGNIYLYITNHRYIIFANIFTSIREGQNIEKKQTVAKEVLQWCKTHIYHKLLQQCGRN